MKMSSTGPVFTGVLNEHEEEIRPETIHEIDKKESNERASHKLELVWINIIGSIFIHSCGIYAICLILSGNMTLRTFIAGFVYGTLCNVGIAGGAHRLFSHRGYKAKVPLRLFYIFWQTLAVQNSMYVWVRDHRVHHKFTETNADPHNIKRGFFFAHMGWLMCKKHPDVTEKGKHVDMSDLERDPYIMWQHKHYMPLALLSLLVVPTLYLKALTSETWFTAWLLNGIGRYSIQLNMTWLINSYAHYYGNRPYDKHVQATDSLLMGFIGQGEGFHNYHHVFPWDYRASELRFFRGVNVMAVLIDFFAFIGLAYDLKTVPQSMVKSRVIRTGDGTHHVWGWGDRDIPKEHIQMTVRIKRSYKN